MTSDDEKKKGDQETNRKRKRTFSELLNNDDLDDDDFLTHSSALDHPSNSRRLSPAQQPLLSLSPPRPTSTPPPPLQPQSQELSIRQGQQEQRHQPLPSPATPHPPPQEPSHLVPTHRPPISYFELLPQAEEPLPSPATLPPPPPPQPQELSTQELFPLTPSQGPLELAPTRPPRTRLNPNQAPRAAKSLTVPAPFPWATDYRAKVHSRDFLLSNQIATITGEVQCKGCKKKYEMEHDLRQKFMEVGSFIAENKNSMNHRAPNIWMNPILPTCKYCEQENSVMPVMAAKKKKINWLFLLLGQMLGCCTLQQLKYFCKHNLNHRSGAKNRVLFLTYLGLCKQLDPAGPFDL